MLETVEPRGLDNNFLVLTDLLCTVVLNKNKRTYLAFLAVDKIFYKNEFVQQLPIEFIKDATISGTRLAIETVEDSVQWRDKYEYSMKDVICELCCRFKFQLMSLSEARFRFCISLDDLSPLKEFFTSLLSIRDFNLPNDKAPENSDRSSLLALEIDKEINSVDVAKCHLFSCNKDVILNRMRLHIGIFGYFEIIQILKSFVYFN